MSSSPEILHLIFTLIGLGLGWYIKHQSIHLPPEVLTLVERLLAVKQHQQAQGYLQDLMNGAGMAAPPSRASRRTDEARLTIPLPGRAARRKPAGSKQLPAGLRRAARLENFNFHLPEPSMYALSVTQPWASLIVRGVKRFETRGWQTRYRGPLAIHAARKLPVNLAVLCDQDPLRALLRQYGLADWWLLPRGAVLGCVDLLACTRVEELPSLPPEQRGLGDFRPGRWAWQLSNPRTLAVPFPFTGRLGIFALPFELPSLLLQGGQPS